jgi:hypothetical protein
MGAAFWKHHELKVKFLSLSRADYIGGLSTFGLLDIKTVLPNEAGVGA